MAARTRLLQLAIAVVNIVIAALVFTSIWPFPSGDVKVDLPSASEVQWTYDNGVVHVTAPFSISNGGFWDIDELTVRYEVTNYSRDPIVSDVIQIGTIKVGNLVSSYLDFEFDLLELYNQGATWMIFNDDMLNFFVEVSCGYTMKMVKFDATYQVSVPWDALVQSYGVLDYTYARTGSLPTDPISVSIQYWLSTSDLLSSLPAAQVSLMFRGNSTTLSQTQTTIQLGGNHSGAVSMNFVPLLDLNATHSIELSVEFAGFPPMVKNYTVPSPSSVLGAIP
jgi:hypothetical protein